jgi:hypothetical protein
MEHELAEKIPWVPIVIFTIIIGFINPIFTLMQPRSAAYWYNMGLVGCMLYMMPMPYVAIFIMVLLSKARLSDKIRPSTLTYLYACTVSLAYPGVADAVFIPASYWVDRYISPLSMELEPWFFAPKPEIAQQILAGGVPIPWAEWLPSTLWWWLLYVLWALFFIGLATILRRHWVDIEKVPFPQTLVAHELVKVIGKEKNDESKLSKSLSIGILIGFIFSALLFMILTFPWFPDLYGWRINTCGFGATYITTDSPLASIVTLATLEKNPLYVAVLYLAPLSILFNGWFWWIVLAILTQIAFTMGYYTALPTTNGCGRIYCGEAGIGTNLPFIWGVFGDFGLVLGIFFSYWILSSGYVRDTIRAAIGKGELVKSHEEEAISYKAAYAMLLVSFVAIMVAFMAASLSILPALMLVFVTLLFGFVQGRYYGLIGYMVPSGFYAAAAFFKPIWPTAPEPRTMEWTVAVSFAIMPASNAAYEGWAHQFLAMPSNYTLASLTGTSPKNVLKVTMFAAILTPILAIVSIIWACYTFGLNSLPGQSFTWGPTDRFTPEFTENWPAKGTWWPQALAGFLAAFILNYLHARFVWFPFEAIGFLFAIDLWSMDMALWQSALIAWIIKTLTLRIGGSKLYESTGRPIAAGFVIGFAIMCVLGGLIGVIRFFFPF